jgi:methylation protein EvaC
MNCKFCGNRTIFVNNFGQMPIANGFHSKDNLDTYRFELATCFCESCKLFQLINQPDRRLMFHKNYPFFTGSSKAMVQHFRNLVGESIIPIIDKIDDPFVVEIGSNDGTLLKNIKEKGVRHLGIDPSENVVQRANSMGIESLHAFFGKDTAESVMRLHGPANVIIAANVICHLPDLKDLMIGIKKLLEGKGVFIFEEPYLGSMLDLVSFDQIYDEHVYIFSLTSISNICEKFDLELFDAIKQQTHGGSMRYFVGHKGKNVKSQRMTELLENEIHSGLDKVQTYLQFQNNCEAKKTNLIEVIKNIKNQGKKISGYAATSKSTTVLNYCGIDSNSIDYICDSTPEKIGKFSPGSNIPIVSIDFMHLNQPDYLILFAWNHESEIMEKERNNLGKQVKWIKFIPDVEIIDCV